MVSNRSAGVTRMQTCCGGTLLVVIVGLAAVTPARADVFVFDFENVPLNVATPATEPSETSATFTATFSSPQDPSGYKIYNASVGLFQNLSGNYLATNAPGNALDVSFGPALSSMSVDFFLYGGATSVDYQLLSGGVDGTVVASGTAEATLTDSFGVEGMLDASAGPFDTIAFLPAEGAGLAIDNLSVDTAVPEPTSLALLLAGLVPLGVRRRRIG
jgi:hypothetical protein